MAARCRDVGSYPHPEAIEILDLTLIKESPHQVAHALVQGPAARYDDAQRDGTVGIEALVVFQISVEEWILVVPLDFQGNEPICECAHVVDLVTDRLTLLPVDGLFHFEFGLGPASSMQGTT